MRVTEGEDKAGQTCEVSDRGRLDDGPPSVHDFRPAHSEWIRSEEEAEPKLILISQCRWCLEPELRVID